MRHQRKAAVLLAALLLSPVFVRSSQNRRLPAKLSSSAARTISCSLKQRHYVDFSCLLRLFYTLHSFFSALLLYWTYCWDSCSWHAPKVLFTSENATRISNIGNGHGIAETNLTLVTAFLCVSTCMCTQGQAGFRFLAKPTHSLWRNAMF